MKKILFVLFAVLFLSGCVTGPREPEIYGNTFLVPYPSVSIEIEPRFKYIGNTKYASSPEPINHSAFVFEAETEVIIIRYSTLTDGRSWEANRPRGIKYTKIAGVKWGVSRETGFKYKSKNKQTNGVYHGPILWALSNTSQSFTIYHLTKDNTINPPKGFTITKR